MRIVPFAPLAMSTEQRSSASGWQNGIHSWVRFAAMTPAMMAVSNTGPFFVRWPVRASSRATAGGNLTVASAEASREVAVFAPTSTKTGRFAASRWVSFCRLLAMGPSTADVVHLDFVQVCSVTHRGAQLAVPVATSAPDAANEFEHFVVGRAGAERTAQVCALGSEQAG